MIAAVTTKLAIMLDHLYKKVSGWNIEITSEENYKNLVG